MSVCPLPTRTCFTPGCRARASVFSFGANCDDVTDARCKQCDERRQRERDQKFQATLR